MQLQPYKGGRISEIDGVRTKALVVVLTGAHSINAAQISVFISKSGWFNKIVVSVRALV